MQNLQIRTSTVEETRTWGEILGKLLQPGDFVGLTGDLGAGKTSFTQGIAAGLGVEEPVTSPTYTLINEYEGRCPVYHFDAYRINSLQEMEDLGYTEYFFGSGVTIVEWADMIESLLPGEHLWVEINKTDEHEEGRLIHLAAKGSRYDKIIEELAKECSF